MGVEQLFVKRDDSSSVHLIVAKIVDDFLISCTSADTNTLLQHLDGQFTLGAADRGRGLRFMECAIWVHDDGSAEFIMHDYLDRIRTIKVARERKSIFNLPASDHECT